MKNFKLTALILAGFVLFTISCQKNINTETPTNEITGTSMIEWLEANYPDNFIDRPKSVNERTADCLPDIDYDNCQTSTYAVLWPVDTDCTLQATMHVTWCPDENTAYFAEVSVTYDDDKYDCDLDEALVDMAYDMVVGGAMTSILSNPGIDADCATGGSVVTSNYSHATCTINCLALKEGVWEWQFVPCASEQACCENIKTWCKDGEDIVVTSETTTLNGQCSGFFSPFWMECSDQFSKCGVRDCE